jgi:hypothetical protein
VTPSSELNPNYLIGGLNTLYGLNKMAVGSEYLVGGTGLDATGVGAPFGVPAEAYGAFQVATGVSRFVRGVRQITEAGQQPTVRMSPLDYFGTAVLGFAPLGIGSRSYRMAAK